MLKISIDNAPQETTFKLEGRLMGPWVQELRRAWSDFCSRLPHQNAFVDMVGVMFVDAEGKQLLSEMHASGAILVPGAGPMLRQVVRDIERAQRHAQKAAATAPECRKHCFGLALFALLLMLIAAHEVRAQQPAIDSGPQQTVRVTLREAVARALKENPNVQIANLRLATSSQDKNIARAALLPQVGAEVADQARKFNADALVGKHIPLFPREAGPFQYFEAGAGFSVPIFDLTLWRRWQAAGDVVRGADAVRLSTREQITLLVVSQYLGAMRADAGVKAAESRTALAQALYDQAKDLQENGVGTGLDTLRANVQLQTEKQRLIIAQTQRKTALYGLARLLDLAPTQNVELADSLSLLEARSMPFESMDQAFISRPEMKALEAKASAAQKQKAGTSESRLPRVTAEGNWGYQGLSATNSIPAYQYSVTMQIPLFTGGRIHAENVKAGLQLKEVEQERMELRNQIVLEVKSATAQLEAARNEVDVANMAVQLANDEVTQARDRFEAGVANNIEVITAQDALARANDNQISALYRYNQARADLARATGQMESLYK